MKTVLTLKYSSFFFCNSLKLVKNTPQEVESEDLDSKDIEVLNNYIKSGSIHSSEGLVTPKEVEVISEVVEEKEVVKEEVRDPLSVLDEPKEDVKKAPVKRTPTKKVVK